MTRRERYNLAKGLLFISPWAIGFVAFTLGPIIASLYLSFTDYNIVQSPWWIGAENYQLLLKDKLFWKSLTNTFYMVLFGLPLGLFTSLALAFLLNMKLRGISIYRTVFYLPAVLPEVAIAILALWLFNPQYGLINAFLALFGISGPGWFADPAWTKPALILFGLWGAGSGMIIYLAGLQDVPQVLYEAADIDGATSWQKTRHITLPMISPILFFNLIMGLIGTLQIFTNVFIINTAGGGTAIGGPLNSMLFYSLYLYQNAFLFLKMGYASAMAWILFVLTLVTTLAVLRSSARWVYYSGESH